MKHSVIVTGGANGIGLAATNLFAKQGYNVIIADINYYAGKLAEDELTAIGYKVKYIHTDTSEEDSIIEMVKVASNCCPPISTLINGAANFIMKGIDASPDDWNKICKTNIAGYALCAKHCLPAMKELGYGVIVNIGSISAYIAQPNFVTYSATKGAILSMTKCMALDLAKFNIRVNSISPGVVWTKSNEDFHLKCLNMSRDEADKHAKIGGANILHRTANTEEIAEAIFFLASNKSSFITATDLLVDGGYIAK